MATTPASDIFLDQSDWREAPLRVDQTIFAIGDVHGCHGQLAVLLDTFKALANNGSARLIFLGDVICRGPNSLAALSLWAAPALEQRFTRVHRLSGNHEQLLMLSIGDDESLARAAYDKWMMIDGATFVDELRRAAGRENAPLGRELVRETAGSEVLGQLETLTEAQKEALSAEGMTLSSNHEVNNRAMITVLSILVHNGTHIDAPRHMVEKGIPIDQMPVSQFIKEGVLINLPGKGANSVVTVKEVAESGVEIRPNMIVMINTGWTDRMWGKPGFWEQMRISSAASPNTWRARARRGWRSTCSRRSRCGVA
jgi:hypothetical protein